MNQSNYVSQPVAQKLVGAGIVLETDFVWRLGADGWKLLNKDWVTNMMSNTYESYPAPCFAEIWRELPSGTRVINRDIQTQVYINYADKDDIFNTNPADAIAEFLIWVKGQEEV